MARSTRIFLLSTVAVFAIALFWTDLSSGQAIKSILRRMDRDNNGYIGPTDEMTPQLAAIARKYGYNPNDWVEISSLIASIEAANATGGYAPSLKKVNGFGNDGDGDQILTPGFGVLGENELTDEQIYEEYDEEITSQMEKTLGRYDDDGNGIIDAIEKRDGNWRNPSFEESDLNKDGALSKSELAMRYQSRVDAEKTSEQIAEESGGGQAAEENRGGRRGGRSNPQAMSERVERYVNGIFERYDTDKNGILDEAEQGEMRRPPTSADSNSDGNITREEVRTFSLRLRGQDNRGDQNTNRNSGNNDSERTSDNGREREPRQSRVDRDFAEKDTDQNGQLQMSEYAAGAEWDGELYDRWVKTDYNGDGVVSQDEWRNMRGQR